MGGGDGGRGEGKKMEERTLGSFLKGRGGGKMEVEEGER